MTGWFANWRQALIAGVSPIPYLLLHVRADADERRGSFTHRCRHLLGAPRPDVAGSEYAVPVGFHPGPRFDETPFVQFHRVGQEGGIWVKPDEHKHAGRVQLILLPGVHILNQHG